MKAKRFLSLVLSFLLVMSSFGTVAFADTEAAGEVASDIPAGFELVNTVESDGEFWEYYVYAGAEAQAETTATVSAYKQVEGPADVEVDGKYFELVNSDIGGNGALESGVTAIKNTNATGGLILVSEGTLVVNNRQDITMDNIIIKGAGESLTTITGDSASFNNTSNGLASSNLKPEYKALIGLPNTVKLMDLTVDGGNCGVVTVQTGLFGIKTYSRADFKVIRANGNSNGTAVSYMENVTAKGDQSRAVIMVGSTSTKTTVYGKALTVVEPKSQGTLDLDRKSVENEGGSIVKLENSFIDGMIIGSAEGLGKGYYKLKTSTGVVVYTTIPKAIEVCNEGYADLIAEYCTNDDIEEGASVAEAMVNDLTTRINGETTLLYGKNCEEMKALTVEFKASLDNIKDSVSVDTDALYEKLNAALAISSWHIADEDGNCKTCGMENIVVIPVIPPVNVEANKENVEVNEEDKEYVDEVIADVTENDAVANAVTNVELNADSIAAAKEKLDAPEGAEVVTTVSVKLIGFEVANGSALKMSFDVEPVAIYNNNSAKLENLTSAVTFRLPVSSKATSANAAVYHEDERLGIYEIKEEDGKKFVEISSKTFSTYTVDAAVVEVSTLTELLTALEDDETNEIIITSLIVIPEGETVTIDLNGHNVSVFEPASGKHSYALNNKGILTLKDSKGTGLISARGIYNGYNGNSSDETVAGAKLIVESGKYIAVDADGGAAIFNCAELVINGGTFEGKVAAVNTRKMGKATINSGTFRSASNGYAIQNNGGILTINNATVDSGFGAVGAYGGTTVINDGVFLPTGQIAKTCHVVYVSGVANVEINGGTYKMNYPADAVPDSGSAVASYYNGTLVINGGTFTSHFDNVSPVELSKGSVIKGGKYLVHSGTPSSHPYVTTYLDDSFELNENGEVVKTAVTVAKIGDTPYATLQAAIDAVKDGETIIILDDITFTTGANGTTNGISYTRDASFNLDLGGHTITSNLGGNALRFKIGDGTEVNEDVVINIYNGKVVSGSDNWCAISAARVDNCTATLTVNLEDLTVENYKAGDYAVKSWKGAVINAKNVTVNSSYGGGFYAVGGEMVLDNCTVTQIGLHTAPYFSMAVAVSTGGKLTVNSGTYTAEPLTVADGYNQGSSHGSFVAGVMNSGGTLIINGGTFTNDNFGDNSLATAARMLIFADSGADVQVNGGTFNALKGVFDATVNDPSITLPAGKVTVSGGTYSAHPVNASTPYGVSLADGYTVNETADGKFEVVKKAVTVAKIGDVEYSSLMAALQDVKSDDTVITLYKDVTEPITSIRGKIVSGSENGVTITSTHNDWLYAAYNFTIDTGVTFNCPYLFLYCNKGVINGKLCISGQYYQMYANTGLYINAPGSMVITGENAILRYTDGNVNTGIFINGDNDDKTVEFKAPYISFYQGLISAKDAVIEVATIWQTNTTDGKGSANFVLDNSIIRQTTNELQFGADGSANIELKNNSFVKLAANPNIAASVYVAADATSDITVNNKSIFGAAILNGSKYLTFANAYEKAAANDIITLNANVQNEFTVSKEITIMLNGYTANIVAGEGYELTSDDESNTIKVIPVSYVAQIGDAKFSSLEEAIEAAESGNTITLLEDIETSETYTIAADKEITLDLNGKKIIATDTKASDNYELFYNYGTFTVQSSVDGGLIELTAENNRKWERSSSIIHNRGGILTVKSGELKHNGGTDMAYAIDNSGNSYGDAATNIEGGSIYSSYTAIRNRMDEYGMNGGGNGVATVNVFGGEIDGSTSAIWGQVSSASNGKPAKGEINISGGNVGTVNVSRNEYSEAMLNITSGTVTNIKAQNGHVKISGGNVTGTLTILNAKGEAVTNDTIISGGIFASDVSDYCVFGYKAEYDSVTGTYGIIDAEVLDTILGYSRHLKGLNPNGIEKYKVHLFAGIDSLKYKNVGYEVTFRGVTKTGESRTVYTSIKGENGTFTPDMFGENSKYIISLDVLFPIDETSADESFTYRVYVTKHTGEKVYSDYKTVNGVYNRK